MRASRVVSLLGPLFFALVASGLAFLAAVSPARGQAASPPAEVLDQLERAGEAYEAGQCSRVLAIYAAIERDQPGQLDGIAHYRRGFCSEFLGRGPGRPDYQAAAALLADEVQHPTAPLEAHFYRVNALLNLEQVDQSKAAAQQAVAAWKAGSLLVAQDSPDAWFRLGKLFRDAGDGPGAVEPFRRALETAEKRQLPLRTAYLERIVRAAREVNAGQLLLMASKELEKVAPQSPRASIGLARARLAQGDLNGARETYGALKSERGDVGMEAQYALAAIDRAEEVSEAGLAPMRELADGRPLSSLSIEELRESLVSLVKDVANAMSGPAIEVPRKRRPGTRMAPAPELRDELWDLQARFSGVLLECAQRGVPMREWAISHGFAQLVYSPLEKVFVHQQRERRERALIDVGELESSLQD
ncbi:MAG: hypothetical protein JSV80_14705 [Acidobacteriota bacterium]|nr:MAG: hypothetical protein JSV80_14705 [Acidobacteriota bacterium]